MARRTPEDQSRRLTAAQLPLPGQAVDLSNRPEHMSHSSASDWHECGAGYVWKKDAPGWEPGNAATIRGTIAHNTLELAYNAGVPTCSAHVEQHFDDAVDLFCAEHEDRETFAEMPATIQTEVIEEARTCLSRLWQFDRHPIGFDIEIVGTEIEVNTNMRGVPFVTHIDLVYRTVDGRLVLVDWKTGKKPKEWYQGDVKKQLWLAASAWYNHTYGTDAQELPSLVTAVWLGDPYGSLTLPVVPAHVKGAVEDMRAAWDGIAANKFETNPGALCSWCPAAPLCVDGRKAILVRSREARGPSMGPYTDAALGVPSF